MTMNYKLMNQLKNDIRRSRTFNMAVIANECGTPACVAGHLFLYATETERRTMGLYGEETKAGNAIRFMADKLGMTFQEAYDLFWGHFGRNEKEKAVSRMELTKEETIAELNRLINKYRARDKRHTDKMIDKIISNTPTPIKQKEKEIV